MARVKEELCVATRTEVRQVVDPILKRYSLSNIDCSIEETDSKWKLRIDHAKDNLGKVSSDLSVAGLFVVYQGERIFCTCAKPAVRD